jgi:glutamyl-tRNA synthetase
MILAPDRSKLSKRHGATSVEEFREQGYLKEAIINYLALLGWSPEGTEEILPLEQIVKEFSLERISKNAAIYDVKKMTWINGHYLRELPLERIVTEALPFLKKAGLIGEEPTEEELRLATDSIALTRDRAKTLVELADGVSYFFKDDFTYDEKGVQKHFAPEGTAERLREAQKRLAEVEPFNAETIETAYRNLAAELGVKAAELIHPTRLAVSGRTIGPGLFELMALLGKEKCLERLDRAVRYIEAGLPALRQAEGALQG